MSESLIVDQEIHFTYKAHADMTSLCQGDVLLKTDALSRILESVHPYFLNDEYKYFMVLSQSCDLVRRNGKNCKTPYITAYYDAFQKEKRKLEPVEARMRTERAFRILPAFPFPARDVV